MSQEPQYPLLRAVSYSAARAPDHSDDLTMSDAENPACSTATSTLVATQDELSVEKAVSNNSQYAASSVAAPSEISLTASDIRAMNDTLSQARQDGEMPHTSSSPMDCDAVLQDFGFLTRLREARGDLSAPAPDSYKQLRVEVARRISERDSHLSEEESKKEAARRVNNYLRSIEKERFYFEAATSSPKSLPSPSFTSPNVDVETFSEEVLSIVESAADQTISGATEQLISGLRRLKAQNAHCVATQGQLLGQQDQLLGQQGQLLEHQGHLLENQGHSVNALSSLIDPQSRIVHASSENLAMLNGLTTHLSQVVMNLPPAINQLVLNAMQQHAQRAIEDVMNAQQRAMLALIGEEVRLRQPMDYDALATTLAQKIQNPKPEPEAASTRRRGRMGRRLMKMVRW